MKILTLRLSDELYNKIWQIHSDTRNNINSINIELIEKGLDNPDDAIRELTKLCDYFRKNFSQVKTNTDSYLVDEVIKLLEKTK